MLHVVVANLQLVDFRKFHQAAILLIGVGESEFFGRFSHFLLYF